MPLHPAATTRPNRSGSALVLALVVISMLSLAAYMFSEFMVTEYKAADTSARQAQARLWAESGVEYVAALLTPDGGGWDADLYDNSTLFHVQLVEGGGFSIVAPLEDQPVSFDSADQPAAQIRLGLIDECAKLNVNTLALFDPEDGTARNMLMALPNMTYEIADAILDWIDSDEDEREFGAESLSYTFVTPRNGPIDTLEELLLVTGVTPALLYGEDANRNGILDPQENDGDVSLPYDNEDDVLDRGWSAYLTVFSLESNLRHSYERFGEERLNLNEPLLTELYDTLEEEYDSDVARFITAYRLYGPANSDDDLLSASTTQNPLNGVGTGNVVTSGDTTTDAMIGRMARAASGLMSGGGGAITRGGLDLTTGSAFEIRSIYDLIDAEVDATVDGDQVTLVSPWTSDPGELQQTLPALLDALTVTTSTVIKGRININQASKEVLSSIPDMPANLPDQIISSRANRRAAGTAADYYSTTGWLLIEGLVDLPTMRLLDGFLTTRGEVYRMQIVGHADRGGPMVRIEAVVDASETVPRVRMLRNLAELGPGFVRDQLPRFTGE